MGEKFASFMGVVCMKRLLIAVLVLAAGPAWALDDLIVENLAEMRDEVAKTLADSGWLRNDSETVETFARLLDLIHTRSEMIDMLLEDAEPAKAQIAKLVALSLGYLPGTRKFNMLKMFDDLQAAKRLLTGLAVPITPHDGRSWRESKHGYMVSVLTEQLNDMLRSFSGDINESRPRLAAVNDLEPRLRQWIDQAYFLSRLTRDSNLKASLVRVGRLLEKQHLIEPQLGHSDAALAQQRSAIHRAVEELHGLERILDREGLDCQMNLASASSIGSRSPLDFIRQGPTQPSDSL